MIFGYARVSTSEQNLDLQTDALTAAGCEKIFTDTISGYIAHRPNLEKAKTALRKGDIFVVWRLDRLGRSLKDLLEWSAWLEHNGIALKSLHENIDTTTPTGKLIFHLMGALAEFERNLIVERTKAGIDAARARGIMGGRPKQLTKDKRQLLADLYNKKEPIAKICGLFGISKPTLYNYIKLEKLDKELPDHK